MNRKEHRTIVKTAYELTYPVLDKLAALANENEAVEKTAGDIAENLTDEERMELHNANMIGIGLARGILIKESQMSDPLDGIREGIYRTVAAMGGNEADLQKIAEAVEEQMQEEDGEMAELEEAVLEGVVEAVEENLEPEVLAEIEADEELSAQVAQECEAIKEEIMPEVIEALQGEKEQAYEQGYE